MIIQVNNFYPVSGFIFGRKMNFKNTILNTSLFVSLLLFILLSYPSRAFGHSSIPKTDKSFSFPAFEKSPVHKLADKETFGSIYLNILFLNISLNNPIKSKPETSAGTYVFFHRNKPLISDHFDKKKSSEFRICDPAPEDAFSPKCYNRNLFHKIAMGTVYSLAFDFISGTVLYFSPRPFTHWSDHHWKTIKTNLNAAFTEPPVWDHDQWYINYVGHPYQGAFYYNSLRSQGVKCWISALFTVFQSALWEFVIEGQYEQPSANDLIVTPALGVLFGEFFHQLTVKFSKNGFTPWEKVAVIFLNPNYVLNNGFRSHRNP